MLEGRREQFAAEVAGGRGRRDGDAALAIVDASIDRLVWYAGWADKFAQVAGSANPVSGPYFNFSIPEPTGVVAIVAPQDSSLLGLVSVLAPVLCTGNTAVVVSLAGASAARRLARRGARHLGPAGRRRERAHRLHRRARAVAREPPRRQRDRPHRRRARRSAGAAARRRRQRQARVRCRASSTSQSRPGRSGCTRSSRRRPSGTRSGCEGVVAGARAPATTVRSLAGLARRPGDRARARRACVLVGRGRAGRRRESPSWSSSSARSPAGPRRTVSAPTSFHGTSDGAGRVARRRVGLRPPLGLVDHPVEQHLRAGEVDLVGRPLAQPGGAAVAAWASLFSTGPM